MTKERYCILTHVYGIYKGGTDELICGAAMETDLENRVVGVVGGAESGRETHMSTCRQSPAPVLCTTCGVG